MRIAYIDFTLSYNSLDIYISGCKLPHCEECHNPELWDFNIGNLWITEKENVSYYINSFDSLIDRVMVFGGDVLDSEPTQIERFLKYIKSTGKELWLFTKYSLEEVPDFVKRYSDYIKTGRYIKGLGVDTNIHYGVKLTTSNQKIYKKGLDYQ